MFFEILFVFLKAILLLTSELNLFLVGEGNQFQKFGPRLRTC